MVEGDDGPAVRGRFGPRHDPTGGDEIVDGEPVDDTGFRGNEFRVGDRSNPDRAGPVGIHSHGDVNVEPTGGEQARCHDEEEKERATHPPMMA
jgi:hypothetical protein